MKKHFTLTKLNIRFSFILLIVLALLPFNLSIGQTTVFLDDFNRAAVSPGGTPEMTYTTTIGVGSGQTATIPASDFLNLQNSTVAGNIYVTGLTSSFASPFNSTLSSNTGIVEWTFNTRYVRTTAPSGLTSGSYGYAVVLAGTSSALHNTGTGYAVVYGNALSPDPVRLVKYSGGLTGTSSLTDVINSGVADIVDIRAYTSVRVKYVPLTNTWSLYVRDDGTGGWVDVNTTPVPDENQKGTSVVDDTYTSSAMTNFGFFWNHSTTTAQKSTFDNFKVTVTVITTPTLSASPTTLDGFSYMLGAGPSTSQSFDVSGINLTPESGNIAVTGSTNYEVSTDNLSFSNSVNIAYNTNSLASTPVYVRLKSGLTSGNYDEEILSVSGGGATAKNVSCSGSVLSSSVTYTWTGATDTDWQVETNWNPNRTTAFENDILNFNSGGSVVVTNLPPSQTIAQLLVSNNTSLELQSAAAANIIINGETGEDLDIATGSELNIIQTTNAITINLVAGTTATVAGNMTFSNTTHKLLAVDQNTVKFKNGAAFLAGLAFSGNAFGTTSLNSIVFESGSSYTCMAGSNPFGASAPNSVVVWEAGSSYVHKVNGDPSLANRTYANFVIDLDVTRSLSSSSPVNFDTLVVKQGVWNIGVKNTFTLKGDVNISTGASFSFAPTIAGTLVFGGTFPQSINNNGILINGIFSTVNVTNSNPLVINNNTGAAFSFAGSLPEGFTNQGTLKPGDTEVGTVVLGGTNIYLGGIVEMDVASNESADLITAAPGSTLDVTNTSLVVNATYTPVEGDVVSLFNISSGIITGTFANITLPAGSGGLSWRLIYTANDISIKYDAGTATLNPTTLRNAYVTNGKLVVNEGDVYNSIGMKVASVKQRTELSLRSGIYVVKSTNDTQKFILK